MFPLRLSILSFQGTKKHSQTALEQQVESMGAHLSSYTSREHTAYYMKTLAKDLPQGEKACCMGHGYSCQFFAQSVFLLVKYNLCFLVPSCGAAVRDCAELFAERGGDRAAEGCGAARAGRS